LFSFVKEDAEQGLACREEATTMLRSSDYHLMLSRGRKAGLTARELNSALALQPVVGGEQLPGQTDCNGFVSGVDAQGRRTFTQVGKPLRS
jgi:hypothetical protein